MPRPVSTKKREASTATRTRYEKFKTPAPNPATIRELWFWYVGPTHWARREWFDLWYKRGVKVGDLETALQTLHRDFPEQLLRIEGSGVASFVDGILLGRTPSPAPVAQGGLTPQYY
jgi:hypothetical protein